jgi:hypothetical protein
MTIPGIVWSILKIEAIGRDTYGSRGVTIALRYREKRLVLSVLGLGLVERELLDKVVSEIWFYSTEKCGLRIHIDILINVLTSIFLFSFFLLSIFIFNLQLINLVCLPLSSSHFLFSSLLSVPF